MTGDEIGEELLRCVRHGAGELLFDLRSPPVAPLSLPRRESVQQVWLVLGPLQAKTVRSAACCSVGSTQSVGEALIKAAQDAVLGGGGMSPLRLEEWPGLHCFVLLSGDLGDPAAAEEIVQDRAGPIWLPSGWQRSDPGIQSLTRVGRIYVASGPADPQAR